MFLRDDVLADGCSLRYMTGAQTRCPADLMGGKTLEMREHLFLILLVSETLLFLNLGTLVSVLILNTVSTHFYLYLLFTWLELSGILGSPDLSSYHSADGSSLSWCPGHLDMSFSSPGHSPEQPNLPHFSSKSCTSKRPPGSAEPVCDSGKLEDVGNRLGCWRFLVRLGKIAGISKIF